MPVTDMHSNLPPMPDRFFDRWRLANTAHRGNVLPYLHGNGDTLHVHLDRATGELLAATHEDTDGSTMFISRSDRCLLNEEEHDGVRRQTLDTGEGCYFADEMFVHEWAKVVA